MSSGTQTDPPIMTELVQRVEEQPDHVAVVDGPLQLTYQELWDQILDRTAWLRAAGVTEGDRVAIVAENSALYLTHAAAVWNASAVLGTIYASTTVADLTHCLNECDPVLVLVDDRTRTSVATAAPQIPLAEMGGDAASAPCVRASTVANPVSDRGTLAWICYSSGTTSRPKAIMISASGLHHGATTYADQWHLTSADRTVVALPLAWTYGMDTTAFATLVRGGTVVLLRRGRPELMIDAVVHHQATFLPGVTTMFTKLVDHLDSLELLPDLSSLRVCLSAGEPRNEKTFARWRAYTGLPVYDNYSATECFPLVTYDSGKDPDTVLGSAGTVVPGSALRVVNPDGSDVPPGEVGEAWGTSPALMLGYWRNPELTATALTEDCWYRTKDLVRVDEWGYVFVVGRMSDVIIRGGSNVSPAEVERVLRLHPDVADACVVGVPDETYGERVVVALIPTVFSLDEKAVLAFCAEQLPAYKVPTESVVVDTLPLNAHTGKADKKQVARLFTAQPVSPD